LTLLAVTESRGAKIPAFFSPFFIRVWGSVSGNRPSPRSCMVPSDRGGEPCVLGPSKTDAKPGPYGVCAPPYRARYSGSYSGAGRRCHTLLPSPRQRRVMVLRRTVLLLAFAAAVALGVVGVTAAQAEPLGEAPVEEGGSKDTSGGGGGLGCSSANRRASCHRQGMAGTRPPEAKAESLGLDAKVEGLGFDAESKAPLSQRLPRSPRRVHAS
jgi:hypothetical protein